MNFKSMNNKLRDKLVDLVPSWVYKLYTWFRLRPKAIKWWIQRANGKMPISDAWNFEWSLARYIKLGLDVLLKEADDWPKSKAHQRKKEELLFIRDFFNDYLKITNSSYNNEKELLEDLKRQTKAFKLLDKHFRGLWD